MKAQTFKQLLSTIPDDEEVFYSSYDNYSENWSADDDFQVKKLFNKKTHKKLFVICGGTPSDAVSEERFARIQRWAAIKNSFPQKKNWSLEDKSWSTETATAKFQVGGFEYPFGICMGRKKLIASYVGDSSKMKEFDDWDEFFAAAEPVVIKAAQKQREELEGLLEK